ncbi:MAG: cysteine desulfurase [Verrucomicrobia bacterium]|nr:MAG: cysteine desulfurase [Verrucomicrobiota bacterium]
MIYLDANATTPLDPLVLEAMLPCFSVHYGNPSSSHFAGRQTRALIDTARDELASLLGCKSHELIFTSGGTEADNLAVLGLARAHAHKGRHLITCQTEHHAVLEAFEHLEKNEEFSVTKLAVTPSGLLDPETLQAALRPETTLVSIMSANNETGVLQPMGALSAICRKAGVLFHSDAVQSFGKEPVQTADFDALSLAAHKFYGPKGAGLLFLKGGIKLEAVQRGGNQEGQRRPGTENPAAIVGMARAATLAMERMPQDAPRVAPLRDRLQEGILEGCPGVLVNGAEAPRIGNTLNVSFPASDAESLLMSLDLEGVCASSGSACMVGSMQPSHVLKAMGVPTARAGSAVRFSLGRAITPEDIEAAIGKVKRVWDRLRA